MQMSLSFSISNIFLLLGAFYVSHIEGKHYLVETEGATDTPIEHSFDYYGRKPDGSFPTPCETEAKEGRNPRCKKEPFPNPYNKRTNADVVQAKRQHYWTYNSKTGKCEEFKGEGYWCQDDKQKIYNMYESEVHCEDTCMPKVYITTTERPAIHPSCLSKKTLPKEPCRAALLYTMTKEGKCEKYEAQGFQFDSNYYDKKYNQYQHLGHCQHACPNCGIQEEKEEEDGTDYLI